MELAFPVAQNGIERAIQTQSVIAHNLANLTTTAFKALRAEAGTLRVPGTQVLETVRNASQGPLRETQRELDLAVAGEGFFILQTDQGQAFTRAGSFHVDEDGTLVTAAGYPLENSVTIPEEAVDFTVTRSGAVFALLPDGDVQDLGQLELARFRNAAGLLPVGNNVYAAGPNSGDAIILEPGEEGAGGVHQGFLELANVDSATEITNQIINQRHFQVNLRAFQVINDLVGKTIDLSG